MIGRLLSSAYAQKRWQTFGRLLSIKAEQQMQEARLHAKPKPDWRTYRPIAPTWAQGVTITPEETPPVGIFSATDTFHASEFIVHNMWERPIGNTWKFAYAGAASTDPASGGTAPFIGAIWTYTGAIGENLEKFPAPAGTGPLTIKSVDGAVLTLQADSGKVIKFNLQTNQYQ